MPELEMEQEGLLEKYVKDRPVLLTHHDFERVLLTIFKHLDCKYTYKEWALKPLPVGARRPYFIAS
jgi:hypothetical protein